jgi:hypothetical protein
MKELTQSAQSAEVAEQSNGNDARLKSKSRRPLQSQNQIPRLRVGGTPALPIQEQFNGEYTRLKAAATKSKSSATARVVWLQPLRTARGGCATKGDCRLAHAGDDYGDVVGLFGCAGPLFGGGD